MQLFFLFTLLSPNSTFLTMSLKCKYFLVGVEILCVLHTMLKNMFNNDLPSLTVHYQAHERM